MFSLLDVCTVQDLNLTIEARDNDGCCYYEEIDVTAQNIKFLANGEQHTVNEGGRNRIGIFNFTYHIQSLENEGTGKCTTEISANNSTDQQLVESSSSPWAWIAVSILFILLTILFFTVSTVVICIIRNMAMKMKETKKESTRESGGEYTYLVQLFEALIASKVQHTI